MSVAEIAPLTYTLQSNSSSPRPLAHGCFQVRSSDRSTSCRREAAVTVVHRVYCHCAKFSFVTEGNTFNINVAVAVFPNNGPTIQSQMVCFTGNVTVRLISYCPLARRGRHKMSGWLIEARLLRLLRRLRRRHWNRLTGIGTLIALYLDRERPRHLPNVSRRQLPRSFSRR